MNDLLPINIDLVRELRRQGRYEESFQLLKAFRADVKKAGRDVYKAECAKERRIRKHHNICTVLHCQNFTEEGKSYCDICKIRKQKNIQNYRDKKKTGEQ